MQHYPQMTMRHAAAEAQYIAEMMQKLADSGVPLIPQDVRPRMLGALAELEELATT